MQTKLLHLMLLLALLTGCSSVPKDSQLDIGLETAAPPETALIVNYRPQAVALFKQANSLRETPTKAQQKYQEAVVIDPSMEPAWFNLARLFFANEQHKELLQLVTSDTIQQALSARILNLLATSLKNQGQFTSAAQYYQQAVAIDASHLASLANFAILTDIYLHNPQAALPWYEKYQAELQKQGKDDPRAKNWIADVKQRIN